MPLASSLERLLPQWRVLHIAGEAGMAAAEATRASLGGQLAERYLPVAYLTDRMTDALVASDLVLGRAGSSTCAEVTAVGVASILIPYPYAGAHQRANADYLADRGAAVAVLDQDFDGERLLAEATRLRDDATRARMAAAAAALGLPHAAETIAAELLAMGEGRPLPSLAGRRRLMGASAGAAAGLAQLDALAAEHGLELQQDAPLAPLTTLRVGGPADRLADARDRDEPAGPAADRTPGGRAGLRAGQRQRPGGGGCRHARPGDPQPRPRTPRSPTACSPPRPAARWPCSSSAAPPRR